MFCAAWLGEASEYIKRTSRAYAGGVRFSPLIFAEIRENSAVYVERIIQPADRLGARLHAAVLEDKRRFPEIRRDPSRVRISGIRAVIELFQPLPERAFPYL